MRLHNGPVMPLKGAMNAMNETETPSEESRMPKRKLVAERETLNEGDNPQTKDVCVETDMPDKDSVRDADGVAGKAGRTVLKEGSVMLGSMPMGNERRVI